ncbi:hypothetical protein AMTR_s00027p00237770, partial [Amborella trichopoda]
RVEQDDDFEAQLEHARRAMEYEPLTELYGGIGGRGPKGPALVGPGSSGSRATSRHVVEYTRSCAPSLFRSTSFMEKGVGLRAQAMGGRDHRHIPLLYSLAFTAFSG